MQKLLGFTLIELLIVILIISIVSGVAIISIRQNDTKRMQLSANEMLQSFQLAEEYALLLPAVIGVVVEDDGWRFMRYQPSEDDPKKNKWTDLQQGPFKHYRLPDTLELAVQLPNQKANPNDSSTPQIIFSPNGNANIFNIFIARRGGARGFQIASEADGNLKIINLN